MKTQVANVSRARKSEAEQAIKDLEARGYELTYPLTNKMSEGKTFTAGENRHVKFVDNVLTKRLVAQLKMAVE